MTHLYIISTPIGNLKDISQRAIETLKEVDLILAEDTRITKRLLDRYEIKKPTLSFHQHSNLKKSEYILEKIKEGKDLALVSDAGTPGINDPGGKLIEFLLKELSDLKIIPIPGPSALTTALSISGFPADRFVFLGFPPIKKRRKTFFKELSQVKETIVLYESPYRILKTLDQLKEVIQRDIVLCRELTKKFETIYRGSVEEVIIQLNQDKIKGEFVIVIKNI